MPMEKCKLRASIWAGTIFERAKLSKKKILRILELRMNNTRVKTIAFMYRINIKAVWRILCKLSRFLVPEYYDSSIMLSGNNQIIEIDESKFGKRKYIRGCYVEGVWIFRMIGKTEPKRIILVSMDGRSKNILEKCIKNT